MGKLGFQRELPHETNDIDTNLLDCKLRHRTAPRSSTYSTVPERPAHFPGPRANGGADDKNNGGSRPSNSYFCPAKWAHCTSGNNE